MNNNIEFLEQVVTEVRRDGSLKEDELDAVNLIRLKALELDRKKETEHQKLRAAAAEARAVSRSKMTVAEKVAFIEKHGHEAFVQLSE